MPKPVMKKSEKKLWLKALRSGLYKQGKATLRSIKSWGESYWKRKTVAYCCLGVATCAITKREPRSGAVLLRDNRFGLSHKLQCAFAQANDEATPTNLQRAFKAAGYDTWPEIDSHEQIGYTKSNYCSFESIAQWVDTNL